MTHHVAHVRASAAVSLVALLVAGCGRAADDADTRLRSWRRDRDAVAATAAELAR